MGGSFKHCAALLWSLVVVVGYSEAGYSPYLLDPSGPGGPPPFGGPLGPSGPGYGGPPGPPPPHFFGGPPPPLFGGPGPFGPFGGFRPFSPTFQGPPPGFPYRQTFNPFPIQQQQQQPYIGQYPVVDPSKSNFASTYTSKVPSINYGPVQNGGATYSGLQVVDPAKSSLFNSYLYQVNPAGYQTSFNGLQNSVSEQQQQQQQYQTQPHSISTNGASLPISYGETFQEEQVLQQPYQQPAPSVAPPSEYAPPTPAAPSAPAPLAYTNNGAAGATAHAPGAALDIQSSYSTYQAPLTNYVYQVSKRPYKFPTSSANEVSEGASSKDVALSAPSNEDMIVAAPPDVLVPPRTDAPEVVFEMTPGSAALEFESSTRSSSVNDTTSEGVTTTQAPLAMKERVRGRRKKVSGGGDKFVFGQRLSRGRSRSPFKNVELDFVDSKDSSASFPTER